MTRDDCSLFKHSIKKDLERTFNEMLFYITCAFGDQGSAHNGRSPSGWNVNQAVDLQLLSCNQNLSQWSPVLNVRNPPLYSTSFIYYRVEQERLGEKVEKIFFFLPLHCLSSLLSRCIHWSSVCSLQQRSVLKGGWLSQTGMGLKEPYCEVTYFPNAGRRRISSWWNYPHESCSLWCLPRLRTWKGIRYGRVLSVSFSKLVGH